LVPVLPALHSFPTRRSSDLILCVEVDEERIERRLDSGYLETRAADLDSAIKLINQARSEKRPISVALRGNAAEVYPEILAWLMRDRKSTRLNSSHEWISYAV